MQTLITHRKINWRIASLLIGLLIVAAFLLLGFQAAFSNTDAQHDSVTTSSGERMPDAMQQFEKITIVIQGEGRLAHTLKETLPAQVHKAGLGDVELVQELKADYPNPVLVVEVEAPSILWTPFYATAQLPVHAGYASNGDTSFLGDNPTVYNSIDGPTLNHSANYQISDRSWGLISYPGYHHYLADYLAHTIADSTRKLYQPK